MEIKDFGELNALNKLLAKIKFHEDLDFYEFKEFCGSPIIADIFKRINDEYRQESIIRGCVKDDQIPTFEFNSMEGLVICKRIDELTQNECETLKGQGIQGIDQYLNILITPLQTTEQEFNLLRKYAEERITGR